MGRHKKNERSRQIALLKHILRDCARLGGLSSSVFEFYDDGQNFGISHPENMAPEYAPLVVALFLIGGFAPPVKFDGDDGDLFSISSDEMDEKKNDRNRQKLERLKRDGRNYDA